MAARSRPQASTLTLTEALKRAGDVGARLWVQDDGSIIVMNPGVDHKWPKRRPTGTGMPAAGQLGPARVARPASTQPSSLPAARRSRGAAAKRG